MAAIKRTKISPALALTRPTPITCTFFYCLWRTLLNRRGCTYMMKV